MEVRESLGVITVSEGNLSLVLYTSINKYIPAIRVYGADITGLTEDFIKRAVDNLQYALRSGKLYTTRLALDVESLPTKLLKYFL